MISSSELVSNIIGALFRIHVDLGEIEMEVSSASSASYNTRFLPSSKFSVNRWY